MPWKDKYRIDYVIVIDKKITGTQLASYVVDCIHNLEESDVKMKVLRDHFKDDIFILLHLPRGVIERLAPIYSINIAVGHTFLPDSNLNIFNKISVSQTPFSQNKDLLQTHRKATSKERILIMEEILNNIKFGVNEYEYGIENLIKFGAFKTAYPLHDGDYYKIDDGAPQNDRQCLLKYWANFTLWYKEQPLNLIEKYFGSEIAFYFAWLGFYNKMLIPAAVVGVICFVISIVQFLGLDHDRVDDICESDIMMCPLCFSEKNCKYRPLKSECEYAKVSVVFDNYSTVIFAIFMSFWATFFLVLWKRYESILKIRWNVDFDYYDTKLRMDYKEKTKYFRKSNLTGTIQPHTPKEVKVWRITLSYATCLLLITVVSLCVLSVILYRIAIMKIITQKYSDELIKHSSFFLTISSSCIQVGFIYFFGMFYKELSEWLTRLEIPRTQTEFDSSVIYKRYILAFSNNYAPLFYHAFLRAKFYSPEKKLSATSFEADLCQVNGCMVPVCVQLCMLMLFKGLLGNILTIVVPKLREKFRVVPRDVPQWEKEFNLIPTGHDMLNSEYMEMIIQYGFVTFFVAAFPLAPLCALINNCIELRLDASKFVVRYRRPVPRQLNGIGPWHDILSKITHLSVVTNAFVLAFTSNLVVHIICHYTNKFWSKGCIRSTLSIFDMRDHELGSSDLPRNPIDNSTFCYYHSLRYPPDHPQKYQLKPSFWFELGMRLVCVIVFEHVIMLTNRLLSHFIPQVPLSVKEKLYYNQTEEINLKMKAHAEKIKKFGQRAYGPQKKSSVMRELEILTQ